MTDGGTICAWVSESTWIDDMTMTLQIRETKFNFAFFFLPDEWDAYQYKKLLELPSGLSVKP